MFHVPNLHSIHFLSNTPQLFAAVISNGLNIPIVGKLEQNAINKFINSRLLEVNQTRLIISSGLDSPKTIENVKNELPSAWKCHVGEYRHSTSDEKVNDTMACTSQISEPKERKIEEECIQDAIYDFCKTFCTKYCATACPEQFLVACTKCCIAACINACRLACERECSRICVNNCTNACAEMCTKICEEICTEVSQGICSQFSEANHTVEVTCPHASNIYICSTSTNAQTTHSTHDAHNTQIANRLFLKQIENFHYLMRLHDLHIHTISFQMRSQKAMEILYERAQKYGAIGLGIDDETALLQVPFTDVLHVLVVKEEYYAEQFLNLQGTYIKSESISNINYIDHIAVAVEKDKAESVVQWYIDALDFERYYANSDDLDHGLVVEGLRTLVLCPKLEREEDASRAFKIVIVEPVKQENGKKSQITEFMEYNGGSGVAHIALHTSDICSDVALAQKNGMEFVSVPFTYYELWKEKEGYELVSYDWSLLEKLCIMVDGNANGKSGQSNATQIESGAKEQFRYLLQTFTHPLGVRPTIYFELIDRRGSTGFGKGNIKQLFDAIALLQKERGNEFE